MRTHTKTYMAWWTAKRRCENPSDKGYKNYGARGIKMHWRTWQSFAKDMGLAPKGTTLDRVDNNGDYRPDNCRWCSPKENMRNRRNNNRLTIFGMTKTLVEWAEYAGIKERCLWMRIYDLNWPLEKAVTKKAHFRSPSK